MFQRELKVNYGSIDRLVGDIETYQNALSVMKQKVKQIWELLEESSGESYESLKERKETILNQISSCEGELGDLHELLAGYSYDMQSAIAPLDKERMMVVDRNDIWCNMESILNACDRISSMVYNVNVPWFGTIYTAFAEDEVKEKERKYGNRLANVREKIQRSYQENIVSQKAELVRLYENKVVVYENTDDEYASRVSSDYYPKYTSLGESFLNVFEWLGEAMTDFTEGVMEGLIGLIDGVGELLWGIGEVAVSGLTVFVCERINCEAPKWAKTKVSEVKKTIGAIMDEPLILLEGISQEISDMGEERGIWYCAGYAAGMYAGGKGLSEAEKAARVKLKGEFNKSQTPKIEIDDALDELAQGERVVVEGGTSIPDLSNKAVKHPMNDHMPARYVKQLQYMSKEASEQYLSYKTFFNSNWTDEQVRAALNYGYKEALNSGVTTGKYSFKYLGENITVCLEDGVFKTGYGNYVYTYDELLKLLGGK